MGGPAAMLGLALALLGSNLRPHWQRFLAGDDLATVQKLIQTATDAARRGDFAAAVHATNENLTFRIARQGADHWQVESETQTLRYFEALAKLAVADRERFEAARKSFLEADGLAAQLRFAEAHDRQLRYVAVCREIFGTNAQTTANAINSAAYTASQLGRIGDAIRMFRDVVAIDKALYGRAHPSTANALNNLAGVLDRAGEHELAEAHLRDAQTIDRLAYGDASPLANAIGNNLAANLGFQRKFTEAMALHREVLERRLRQFGDIHPEIAQSYGNLAGVYSQTGRLTEARTLHERALSIRRIVHGERHVETAIAYGNLAAILGQLRRAGDAEILHRRALAIESELLGNRHPRRSSTLYNLARTLQSVGRHDEANRLLDDALTIARTNGGDRNPLVALCLQALAADRFRRGDSAAARERLGQALAMTERNFGEFHPETMNILLNLRRGADAATARALLERAVRCYEGIRTTTGAGLARADGLVHPGFELALALADDEPTAAFRALESALARGLLDHRAGIDRGDRSELAEVNARLAYLARIAERGAADERELENAIARRRALEAKILEREAARSRERLASLDAIRAALPEDAALVVWLDSFDALDGTARHRACIVRRTGEPRWVALPDRDRDSTVRLRNALNGPATTDEIAALAGTVRDRRIVPLLPHLKDVKALLVVPILDMAGVPVELLAPEFIVGYVPSGTLLADLKRRPAPVGRQWLALGDPAYAAVPTNDGRVPPDGMLVAAVKPQGSAAKAGLAAGDVIVTLGERPLTTVEDWNAALTARDPAKGATLEIARAGPAKPRTIELPPGPFEFIVDPNPAPRAAALIRDVRELLAASRRGGAWKELPGTALELAGLRRLAPDLIALTRADATAKRLDELRAANRLAGFRILHFAVHGEANPAAAFESSLILQGDATTNLRLAARTVLETWTLDAELVTLSACESALGKSGGGDGLLGFAPAFLAAGARAVCVSLWKVDDAATALLMGRFYENLLGRRAGLARPLGKAAALDEAKRWLRTLTVDDANSLVTPLRERSGPRGKDVELNVLRAETPDAKPFAHPKFWAAFILIGDPN